MMQCRGCGKDLDGSEHRLVADWPFCLPCFEQLLSSKEKPAVEAPVVAEKEKPTIIEAKPVMPEEPAEASRAPDPATQSCSLCGTEIDAEAKPAKFGPLRFCQRCVDDRLPSREETPAEADRDEDATPEEPTLNPSRPIACDGCGRQIPMGGSKVLGEGRYCPECYLAKT